MSEGPRRILHVLRALNRGGVETWLMHVLRRTDRERFAMDFLVQTQEPGEYDEEARALGARIIHCTGAGRPWVYARRFREVWREQGPWDIVHSHVHHYSGMVLRLAAEQGARVRIAHSHNDTRPMEAGASLWRRGYLALMEHWIHKYATLGLACSRPAAESLFGERWERDRRWRMLYYGIGLGPFAGPLDREALRASLGLPEGALVVGHVGRFMAQKNHGFLVEVFARAAHREPRLHLLLVGEGPLRASVERQVTALHLAPRVTFAGSRPDVADLMRGAMDLLLMPSLHEGLPLTGLEAQAAGLPALWSEVVTAELDAVAELVQRLPLAAEPAVWAEEVLRLLEAGAPLSPTAALERMQESHFNVDHSVAALHESYAHA